MKDLLIYNYIKYLTSLNVSPLNNLWFFSAPLSATYFLHLNSMWEVNHLTFLVDFQLTHDDCTP